MQCIQAPQTEGGFAKESRSWSVGSELAHCTCRAMQDECNALELELKHHEKGFAELVSEELEQRFMRFEEVTLAAVQKMVGIISAPEAAPAGEAGVHQIQPLVLTGDIPVHAYSLCHQPSCPSHVSNVEA